ncbi:unnamed protein product [Boreogadus saida]
MRADEPSDLREGLSPGSVQSEGAPPGSRFQETQIFTSPSWNLLTYRWFFRHCTPQTQQPQQHQATLCTSGDRLKGPPGADPGLLPWTSLSLPNDTYLPPLFLPPPVGGVCSELNGEWRSEPGAQRRSQPASARPAALCVPRPLPDDLSWLRGHSSAVAVMSCLSK